MKEKNYWPHAIVGVLIFGVFMVSVSITIAMKNPIQDENTYFAKKRIVDENINNIIKDQNLFNDLFEYSIYIKSADDLGKEYAQDSFIFPYYAPAHRPDIKSKTPPNIIPPSNIYLAVNTKQHTHSPIIQEIHLFLDSMHEADKIQDLGHLKLIKTIDNADFDALWQSDVFNNLPLGRWKFVLEITYDIESEALREPSKQLEHKAYFESEVFIKDKPTS